jgi:hypothetical protein
MTNYAVKNSGQSGNRVIYDRGGHSITIGPGQTKTVDIPDEQARRIQARGGVLKVGRTAGAATLSAEDLEVARGSGGGGGGGEVTTTQQEARALIEQSEDMDIEAFKEASKQFLGDKLPRGKKAIITALEEIANS